MRTFLHTLLLALLCLPASAAITKSGGWLETAYAEWQPVTGAASYNVYICHDGQATLLDAPLVRRYATCFRADAPGLKAGEYTMRVDALDNAGAVLSSESTPSLTVTAHDRSGFAHVGMADGIGAYRNDGTLKSGAKVIYVTAANARTVTTTVLKDKTQTTCVGMQAIIDAYQKGSDHTPICFRLIGTIKKADMPTLSSSAEGLQIKGKTDYSDMPITIEGIGRDATIHGFGMLLRNCKGVELRNFGIMLCMDDALSLDTKNSNIWIHNIDFFYGSTGGDSDQAKGDGTCDIKASSTNVTVAYCHFFDNGKSSLGGMSNESTACRHTFHHNWFDHSDSRHPRIRVQFFHVYNNYYDGNAKYGVGAAQGGTAFVEQNYFRNCHYPMLSSKQGTDAEGDGTFSGEPGGVIKAFDNVIVGNRQTLYYTPGQTDGHWDAVLAQSRDEQVTATAYDGATPYNNDADRDCRTQYIENRIDAPQDVPAIVTRWAGRMDGGDFHWAFRNATQDENYAVIAELKTAITAYQSQLIGLADGTTLPNGGATADFNGGDGQGLTPEENNAYVPSWVQGGTTGGGTQGGTTGGYVLGSEADYFWLTADNAEATQALLADGTITLSDGSKFQTSANVTKSDGTVLSDRVGSLQLAKGDGYATFHNAAGITAISFYLVRTGSLKGEILTSDDGQTFTQLREYTGKTGVLELPVTLPASAKYVRLTNTATGSLHIQGIRLSAATADGVTAPRADSYSSYYYTPSGQRLAAPRRGLNITAGRKVVVR